jgi:hypothetical protein
MNTFSFDLLVEEHVVHGFFVDRPNDLSYADLADALYNRYRGDLGSASLVVIRLPVDAQLPNDDVLRRDFAPVFARVPNLPIHALGSRNFRHHLSANLNELVAPAMPESRVNDAVVRIRDAELRHFAVGSRAVLRTTGPRIFRAPSKKYCRAFLRVGNVQTSREALDAYFFWLLPSLETCKTLLTDTWTISSIALNAARLLARYSPQTHTRCEVDMLPQYHDGGQDVIHATKVILQRSVIREGNLQILISASMSGNLARRLRHTITELGMPMPKFRFSTLYRLGPALEGECLCDASTGLGGATFECFDEPPADALSNPVVIDIDPQTYFPLRVECVEISISRRNADGPRDFWDAYRNTGLACVHRDSITGGQFQRHHGIYLDVSAILSQPRFIGKVGQWLESIPSCPALVISPPHQAGNAMAQLLRQELAGKFEKVVSVISHPDLRSHEVGEAGHEDLFNRLRSLRDEDSIVIVDDVSITGRRLSRFQMSLRELGYRGQIHYAIGVARPSQASDWDKRVRQLRFRQAPGLPSHTVHPFEKLVLPDWDRPDCPWCLEQTLLRRLSNERGELPRQLSERAVRLQKAAVEAPMIDDAFLLPEGAEPFRLTPNSIFCNEPASQADMIGVISSCLQGMRTDSADQGYLSALFPEMRVLHSDNYLGGQFNDSIIRAALLRCSKHCELEHPQADGEKRRHDLAAGLVNNDDADIHNLVYEIVLAIAQRKLPVLSITPAQRTVIDGRGWGDVVQLFLG